MYNPLCNILSTSIVYYTDWDTDNPTAISGKTGCVVMSHAGKWSVEDCDTALKRPLCEASYPISRFGKYRLVYGASHL